MHATVVGEGRLNERAWARYMEVACRVTARCTDEELGVTLADDTRLRSPGNKTAPHTAAKEVAPGRSVPKGGAETGR